MYSLAASKKKSKKARRCGACGSRKHDRRTCPMVARTSAQKSDDKADVVAIIFRGRISSAIEKLQDDLKFVNSQAAKIKGYIKRLRSMISG